MTSEEILEKYGIVFTNYKPVPGAAIKVVVDTEKISFNDASDLIEHIRDLYPEHKIFTTFKNSLEVK